MAASRVASLVLLTCLLTGTGYATDASRTGTLTVSGFDMVNRNIRGTFSFTGYHAGSGTVVNVTSGTFDVSF